MLTLPDTDAWLTQASHINHQNRGQNSGQDELLVQHEIVRPTPWSSAGESRKAVVYRKTRDSDEGWTASLTVANASVASASVASASPADAPVDIQLDAPVLLNPIAIAKPWGQEIWYSGIEERGESSVTQGTGTLLLSDYLSLAPQRLVKRATPLLLKILDPKPDPNEGCLYFETHNTKHEVYVVTDVDPLAWPSGVGAIRLGMDQDKRNGYATDEEFRTAYLHAVQAYEAVRRSIDANSSGQSSHNESSQQERVQEREARAQMEAFTARWPLSVGDVVQVSPHIPHSLQHGVRVFEFQTPTYERNIISFNQQVLTQDHWDSSYAIKHMSLGGPTPPTIETLSSNKDRVIERLVDFADFDVERVTLGSNLSMPLDLATGCLMIAVLAGDIRLSSDSGHVDLSVNGDHRAGLVPACASNARVVPLTGAGDVTFLVARPKSHTADTIAVC